MQYTSTILVVDDESGPREILGKLLTEQGYNLAFATSGEEALVKAAELTPDLILLDVMMPDIDGFTVCQRLRSDPLLAEIPVIMITGLNDRTSLLQGIEAGADDFISKPFDPVELEARVRVITRLNRYRRLHLERAYRQQAEEELHRRDHELTLLNRVIVTVASTLHVQDVLYVACESLAHAFDLPQATAILLDEQQVQFAARVEYQATPLYSGQTSLDKDQTPGQGDALNEIISAVGFLPKYLLEYRSPLVVVVDDKTDPRLAQIHDLMHESGIGSLLIVPLLTGDQVAGIIELKATERHYFDVQDVTLAQSVATAVGQAVENAQLYQTVQHQANILEETVTQLNRELQTERDRTRSILKALSEAVVATGLNREQEEK